MCLLWLPYPLMLVNRAICGFLGSNSAILRSSAVQRYIPERLRSRVNALNSVLLSAGASVFSLLMGFLGGSARLSLVRHARRRSRPAGLSFSHRGQAAGCSKGVRGGLSPSRPHFAQRLPLAHGLIIQRDCPMLDSPFSYPVLYSFAVKMLNRAKKMVRGLSHFNKNSYYTNWRRLRSASACSSSLPYHMMPGNLR